MPQNKPSTTIRNLSNGCLAAPPATAESESWSADSPTKESAAVTDAEDPFAASKEIVPPIAAETADPCANPTDTVEPLATVDGHTDFFDAAATVVTTDARIGTADQFANSVEPVRLPSTDGKRVSLLATLAKRSFEDEPEPS